MHEVSIRARLLVLRTEHRELDDLILVPTLDQLHLARLKRRKLALRDEIAAIEDQLVPDIIA